MRALIVLGLALLAAGGCASTASTSSGGQGSSGVARRATDVITSEEIASSGNYRDAYELIQKLRPRFVQTNRATPTPSDPTGAASLPVVYVDGISFGDLASLRNIPADQVREVRFLSASDATTRFGTGHSGGVILVSTKK